MITVVSVCNGREYDWQSAIDYRFEDQNEAIEFLKLSLSQGFKCLIFHDEKGEEEGNPTS
jgi:hypothetical protein